jgi:hypothetical protein
MHILWILFSTLGYHLWQIVEKALGSKHKESMKHWELSASWEYKFLEMPLKLIRNAFPLILLILLDITRGDTQIHFFSSDEVKLAES